MYSMGTHIGRGTSMANDLRAKAEAYGMRFAECDGLDVIDVYNTFRREVANTRNAKNPQWKRGAIPEYRREGQTPGPCFCVVHTYRYQGHSMSDPQKYRTKEEVAERQERDAINTLVNHLIENKLATQEQIEEMDNHAKEAAKAAIQYAEESPDLGKDELYTDVYANPFGPYTNPGPSIFMQETGGE
jgi:pyruvate dehydrogenase E1 component alpha subunit